MLVLMMSTLLTGAGMAVLLVELSVNKVETLWLESSTDPLEVESLMASTIGHGYPRAPNDSGSHVS